MGLPERPGHSFLQKIFNLWSTLIKSFSTMNNKQFGQIRTISPIKNCHGGEAFVIQSCATRVLSPPHPHLQPFPPPCSLLAHKAPQSDNAWFPLATRHLGVWEPLPLRPQTALSPRLGPPSQAVFPNSHTLMAEKIKCSRVPINFVCPSCIQIPQHRGRPQTHMGPLQTTYKSYLREEWIWS